MSDDDEEPPPLYRSLLLSEPGAWYWIGIMFPYLVRSLALDLNLPLVPHPSIGGDGAQCEVTVLGRISPYVGAIVFNRPWPEDAPATALIWSFAPEYDAFWDLVCVRLQTAHQQARALRRTQESAPSHDVDETK